MSQRWRELDEPELLRRACGDDPEPERRAARSELLRRHLDRVYHWCYRYARDHDGAMDLAQQVLLRAHTRLDSFEGRSRFSSWLFSVTRSVCLNAQQRVTITTDPEFELEGLVDDAPDPLAQLEQQDDRAAQLRLVTEVLDEVEQEAFVLRYYEQLSPDEITRLLELRARSGARAVLQRARRKLAAAVAARRGDSDRA